MVDYRKFDAIVDSDDDEEESSIQKQTTPQPNYMPEKVNNIELPTQAMSKKGKEGRLKFEHQGRTIYEWEQSLTEVNIYIEPPAGIPNLKKALQIVISHRHLTVGLKNSPPFIDETTGGPTKPDESMWMIVDNEININLQKMNKAEAWECALVGQAGEKIDVFTKEELKKKLMRERFQEEHPGFDFSGAEFNGQVPDARDFMGGVKYF